MIVLKFRTEPEPNGNVFVTVFAGDPHTTMQNAGRLLLKPEEWELLRRSLAFDSQRLIVEDGTNAGI